MKRDEIEFELDHIFPIRKKWNLSKRGSKLWVSIHFYSIDDVPATDEYHLWNAFGDAYQNYRLQYGDKQNIRLSFSVECE